jgi:hypothetical protein
MQASVAVRTSNITDLRICFSNASEIMILDDDLSSPLPRCRTAAGEYALPMSDPDARELLESISPQVATLEANLLVAILTSPAWCR